MCPPERIIGNGKKPLSGQRFLLSHLKNRYKMIIKVTPILIHRDILLMQDIHSSCSFFFFWLHWVFVAVCGLSLVVASGGYFSSQCAGFSLWWLLLLWSPGSRRVGFSSCSTQGLVVVAHGLCCSVACGIFPDQGSNPCPLHWQVDS